jgi:hypothetical protein
MKFIILAHARSGSSTLLNLLDVHPQIKMITEPFNPDRGPERENSWPGGPYRAYLNEFQKDNEEEFQVCLNSIFSDYTGFKHLYYQLGDKLNYYLLNNVDKVIFLTRKNLLQAAVSADISTQTKYWNGPDRHAVDRFSGNINLDYIKGLMEFHAHGNKRWRDYLQDQKIDFTEITYEDIYLNKPIPKKVKQIQQLFSFLGYEPTKAPRARLKDHLDIKHKMSSRELYNRISNIHEVERLFGSKEHGFIFK